MNNVKPLLYFDNAATSFPKPEMVYQRMDSFYRQWGANPGRAGHTAALEAQAMVERCRAKLSDLIHAGHPRQIVWAMHATDALNMAIHGLGLEGGEVILGNLEHNALSRPLYALQDAGIVTCIELTARNGVYQADDLREILTPKTRLVALGHISNVTGQVQNLTELGRCIKENSPAMFLVDAAQSTGIIPIDVQAMNIDLLAMTGHKSLYGPTGTGALYIREGLELKPWRYGGTGSRSEDRGMPLEMPDRFEAGTLNVSGLAGLEAGLDFLAAQGIDSLRTHKLKMMKQLEKELQRCPGLVVYSAAAAENPAGLLTFNMEGIPAYDLMIILDMEYGIEVRAGLHCAPGVHRALGTLAGGAVRVSLGAFNTPEQADNLVKALCEIIQAVRG